MNGDQIKDDWKQKTGKVKEKWGKLPENDLTTIAGQRDRLVEILQERYRYVRERAEKELRDFTFWWNLQELDQRNRERAEKEINDFTEGAKLIRAPR